MGLVTTHNCWRGAYSAFHNWRCKLAEVAGYPPLGLMEGFYDEDHDVGLSLRLRADALRRSGLDGEFNDYWFDRFRAQFPIRWDKFRPDPLIGLLRHSDFDGAIPAADCAPLADRLAELIPLLPEGDAPGHIRNWRDKTQQFVDGLRLAASRGEDVEFR